MPWALAQRSTSTEPAVETWATWTREPVWRASITSRATIDLLGDARASPGSPRRPDTSPSWQHAAGPARVGSWACWETTPPNALTYSSARRITRASWTHLPSSEKTRTRGPRAGHQAELGELLAGQAAGHGAHRLHVRPARPRGRGRGRAAAASAVSVTGRGVGHRQHGGVAADRGGPRAGEDRLGVLAAGLAQVRVQVDEAGQGDEAVGVEDLGPRGRLVDEQARVVDVQVPGPLAQQRGAGDHQPRTCHQDSSPASRW